jgi:AhpD family alkylhydroperoxidase
MATVKLLEEAEAEADARLAPLYAEIRKTLGTPFVPNLFKLMAHHPAYLETTWNRYKAIMLAGKLDRRTKEIIALAVSATNNCEYCVNAHTAVLKGLGLDDAAIVELMAVVDLYSGFNKFLDGLLVESDLKP